LQGDVASAQLQLLAIKTEIVDIRTSVARSRYVIVAALTTLVAIAIFTVMMTSLFARFPDYDTGADPFWAAAAIGAVGAWFSIALAIRGRTVHTDLQTRDNDVDAVLRVMIGVISAVVLLALLRMGLVSFVINNKPVSLAKGDGLIVVAFAAGFSERLVSDFLTQSLASALKSGATALASAAAATPPVKSAPGADELHPMGQAAPPGPGAAQDDGVDDADACGDQGLNVQPADQTPDTDLPAATGGVAGQ
jgi:membrane protein YdbS with pleckstrin-like domain